MKIPFYRILALIIIALACNIPANAIDLLNPALHCAEDTTEINTILKEISDKSGLTEGALRAEIALRFVGRPIDKDYATDSLARPQLNVHTFTPLSLINTTEAIVKASKTPGASGWRAVAAEYDKIACRRGIDEGFPSLVWLGSDWIADNIYRGNIKELTENYDGASSKTKSLDYMTRHRDDFAALADDEIYDKVMMTEMGFRTHRLPFLKRQHIERKDVADEMQDGDILMLLTNEEGIDIWRVGYVVSQEDGRHLVWLDPQKGEVVMEKMPIDRFFKFAAKHFYGFRWLRWR